MEIQILDLLPIPKHGLKYSVTVTQAPVESRGDPGLRIHHVTIEIDEVVQYLFSAVSKIMDLGSFEDQKAASS